MGNVVEEEEEAPEQPNDEPSDSESSSQIFGFAAAAARKRPTRTRGAEEQVPKARRKGTAPTPAPAADDDKKDEPIKTTRQAKGKGTDTAVAKADSFISFVNSLEPLAVWQGTVKASDIDAKSSKAVEVMNQLALAGGKDQKAEALSVKLSDTIKQTCNLVDYLTGLQNKLQNLQTRATQPSERHSPMTMEPEERKYFNHLPKNVAHAILTDFGRAATEARMLLSTSAECSETVAFLSLDYQIGVS